MTPDTDHASPPRRVTRSGAAIDKVDAGRHAANLSSIAIPRARTRRPDAE